MKKILLWMLMSVLIFTGCQKSGKPDYAETTVGSGGGSEGPTSKTLETTETSQSSQDTDHALPDYVCSGRYYKLEVTPTIYDTETILKYLIPGFDKSRVQQDGKKYSIEIGHLKHIWILGEDNFLYFNDSAMGRMLTEKEALADSNDLVKQIGFEAAENPGIRKEEDGSYTIQYSFQYEGVPILGNGSIDLKNGDENGFAYGEYIEVSVNGNGIREVYLNHLYDLAAVLGEYQAEELISRNELSSIINFAMDLHRRDMMEWAKREGREFSLRVEEIELIYIPWQEKGKWVLLPAFSVRWVPRIDGVAYEPEPMLIDAVSGYVYRR